MTKIQLHLASSLQRTFDFYPSVFFSLLRYSQVPFQLVCTLARWKTSEMQHRHKSRRTNKCSTNNLAIPSFPFRCSPYYVTFFKPCCNHRVWLEISLWTCDKNVMKPGEFFRLFCRFRLARFGFLTVSVVRISCRVSLYKLCLSFYFIFFHGEKNLKGMKKIQSLQFFRIIGKLTRDVRFLIKRRLERKVKLIWVSCILRML